MKLYLDLRRLGLCVVSRTESISEWWRDAQRTSEDAGRGTRDARNSLFHSTGQTERRTTRETAVTFCATPFDSRMRYWTVRDLDREQALWQRMRHLVVHGVKLNSPTHAKPELGDTVESFLTERG
jgi:hypothetical protein